MSYLFDLKCINQLQLRLPQSLQFSFYLDYSPCKVYVCFHQKVLTCFCCFGSVSQKDNKLLHQNLHSSSACCPAIVRVQSSCQQRDLPVSASTFSLVGSWRRSSSIHFPPTLLNSLLVQWICILVDSRCSTFMGINFFFFKNNKHLRGSAKGGRAGKGGAEGEGLCLLDSKQLASGFMMWKVIVG